MTKDETRIAQFILHYIRGRGYVVNAIQDEEGVYHLNANNGTNQPVNMSGDNLHEMAIELAKLLKIHPQVEPKSRHQYVADNPAHKKDR